MSRLHNIRTYLSLRTGTHYTPITQAYLVPRNAGANLCQRWGSILTAVLVVDPGVSQVCIPPLTTGVVVVEVDGVAVCVVGDTRELSCVGRGDCICISLIMSTISMLLCGEEEGGTEVEDSSERGGTRGGAEGGRNGSGSMLAP